MSNPNSSVGDERLRVEALGERVPLGFLDRAGIWLSARQIRKRIKNFSDLRIADLGCGYNAMFVRSVLDEIRGAVLVDVALSPDLRRHPKVSPIEGYLPGALSSIESESQDLVMCISVLEHLWDPLSALKEIRRVLAPGAVCLLSVPTWRGKWFLELSSFRLKISRAGIDEMDDHKMYYDLRDFWPLLVQAGFLPHQIRCYKYKFGIGLFAVCRLA